MGSDDVNEGLVVLVVVTAPMAAAAAVTADVAYSIMVDDTAVRGVVVPVI